MKYIFILILIATIPLVSAAHYIVGQVNNAQDLTSANGRTIVLWNPSNGIVDNITDIIGQTGNSGTDNVYFVDCESLSSSCQIGDKINAKVFDGGDEYLTETVNVTVSGAGFDLMPELNLSKEIFFYNLSLEDMFSSPANEIDLAVATTTLISCTGIIEGINLDSLISNVSSELFSNSNSFYGDNNQNYKHYTNNSCTINYGYGNIDQVYVNCSYNIQYYAIEGNWTCFLNATKINNINKVSNVTSHINSLLALELPDSIIYESLTSANVSYEKIVNITNLGNSMMNLSLRGYGSSIGDNLSMVCPTSPSNISIFYEKYNLTTSNPGNITLQTFENNYANLTSSITVKNITLDSRKNDMYNEAVRSTYWRIYVPAGISGICSGRVIFGAVSSSES